MCIFHDFVMVHICWIILIYWSSYYIVTLNILKKCPFWYLKLYFLSLHFLSLFSAGTTVYSNIVIKKPQDVIAFPEEPLTWDCRVDTPGYYGPYERVWTFGHHVINTTHNAHSYVLANGSLYIDSVGAQRDPGSYRCCVKNETGTLCSQEALLQIAGK